jgi:hypothetical protein
MEVRRWHEVNADDPQWMLTQLTPAKYGIYVLTHPQITSIGM